MSGSGTTIVRSEHNVSRANISENALKVLYRLKSAGFAAYLVGGGVRDMLLGREPKDFDIATDAHPDEVKMLFRNCRLIGRRFRLAHIVFGRELIEVATFRGQSDVDGKRDHKVDESGRVVRDNVYGSLEEDAWRRDFTINALYYNIRDFSVVDYTAGMADLEAGVLRLIGDPEQRYREDPVRMLRAVRFAAKIGFRIHSDTEKPLFGLGDLLEDISSARLFDEVMKLFMSGYAVSTYELLRHYGLFKHLFPQTEHSLNEEEEGFPHLLVARALANTDSRIAAGKPVTPAFLYAALLWEPVRVEALWLQQNEEMSEQTALSVAGRVVVDHQVGFTALPKRFRTPMQEIWGMQSRLRKRAGKRVYALLEHPRFRAAYDFMLLRCEVGEEEAELAGWWTRIQEVDEEEQAAMIKALASPARRSRGSRRRRRRKSQPSEE